MSPLWSNVNIFAECRAFKMKLWHCPPFLFLVMGCMTIVAMLATYAVASNLVDEPEAAALIVMFVAALFLVVGNVVIRGFHEIAEANRTKSEFVSIISHQLGTPLSVFRLTLGLVEREMLPGSERGAGRMRDHVKTLTDTTDSMIGLVRILLEASRIEAGDLALKKEPLALDALTERMVENFQDYAGANNVRLTLDVASGLPRVRTDAERIAMAVQNLIDNAIRYSPRGGNVRIEIRAEGRGVRWSITDTGVGIPPLEQRYIFHKFFRAGNAQDHHTRGSGIGLYVAKGVVEASGGSIGFLSEEGRGSTFWFTLPAAA